MRRLLIPLLILGTMLFVAGGVGMAITRQGSERVAGAVSAVFFAGCGGVFLLPLFTRRRRGAVMLESLNFGANLVPAFTFHYSPAKLALVLFGSLTFATAGMGMFVYAPQFAEGAAEGTVIRVVGIVTILFFGFCGLATAVSSLKRRPLLALVPEGFLSQGPRSELVQWDAISGSGLFSMGPLARLLGLRLHDPEAYSPRPAVRRLLELNRSRFGWDLAFPVHQLTVTPETLATAVAHYLAHAEERSDIGTPDGFAHLEHILSRERAAANPVRTRV